MRHQNPHSVIKLLGNYCLLFKKNISQYQVLFLDNNAGLLIRPLLLMDPYLGHFCVILFCIKVDGFLRKTHFSCIWCKIISRKRFSASPAFSLLKLEMGFLESMENGFPRKTSSSSSAFKVVHMI